MSEAVSIEEQKKILTTFVDQCRKKGVKMIVLDMDRTLIAMHTSGALLESKLDTFKRSLSSVARALVPVLLEEKFEVSVSTLSDDLYSDLLMEKDKLQHKSGNKYFSGIPLVNQLLGTFLTAEQIKPITLVTLNPALYRQPSGDEDPLLLFYHKKLDIVGLPALDAKDIKNADWLKEARHYPPANFKNQHLRILRALKGIQFHEMLLIDDKAENVNEAIELGAHGVLVPGKKALEWLDLTKILSPSKPKVKVADAASEAS